MELFTPLGLYSAAAGGGVDYPLTRACQRISSVVMTSHQLILICFGACS